MDKHLRVNTNNLLKLLVALLVCTQVVFGVTRTAYAQETDERRISVGIKLFPAVLAADKQIARKAERGFLRILVVYDNDKSNADRIADGIYEVKSIKGMPFSIDVRHHDELSKINNASYAAIFVAQNLYAHTNKVVAYGVEHRIITFSPIKGDVEAGMASGFFVSDQIRPYVNINTLADSKIELKSFFIKVAKQYPEGQ